MGHPAKIDIPNIAAQSGGFRHIRTPVVTGLCVIRFRSVRLCVRIVAAIRNARLTRSGLASHQIR